MAIVNLSFSGNYSPPSARAVALAFGSTVAVLAPASIALVLGMAAPVWAAQSAYDAGTKSFSFTSKQAWQQAAVSQVKNNAAWSSTQAKKQLTALPWQHGTSAGVLSNENFSGTVQTKQSASSAWQQAHQANQRAVDVKHLSTRQSPSSASSAWQQADLIQRSAYERWVQLVPRPTQQVQPWEIAQAIAQAQVMRSEAAASLHRSPAIAWEITKQPNRGRELPHSLIPPFAGYQNTKNLDFICKFLGVSPARVRLNFGLHPCPEQGITVPSKKVYFIVNSFRLKRVSDNQPITVLAASTGTDKNSWCWSFDASIPYDQLEKVEPSAAGTVEVELEINGIAWRFDIEKIGMQETFGKTSIRISGRSITSRLDAPYAPTRSFAQTAASTSVQLASSELERIGLSTGFSLDWQLVDALGWPMPAGTWSYSDLTPVQAIQAIAQGGGGYVNSHRTSKQLLVLPEYAVAPWDWDNATVAKIVPKSIIKSRNTDWSENPAYNGVYVSGEQTGVRALVKRTGTAGNYQAPMFVSPMISHSSAARSKGLAILSAGGKKANVGLDLPMEASIGLLTPSMLIEVTNGGYGNEPAWRGLVRSTSVSAAWSNGLSVNQSVSLERHFGAAA